MEGVVQRYRRCVLQPKCFFVSWNGVLTLVYNGFPPQLENLKSELQTRFPSLRQENPGSLWPKTSLAAVKENKRLTPEQFMDLNTLCKSVYYTPAFVLNVSRKTCREHSHPFSDPDLVTHLQIEIDGLSLIVYACRSLERIIACTDIPLAESLDRAPPSFVAQETVERVIRAADEDDYWYYVSRDGNREGHYRNDELGVTLAHKLRQFQGSSALTGVYERFVENVERTCPGMYSWFSTDSLHVTIRGVVN